MWKTIWHLGGIAYSSSRLAAIPSSDEWRRFSFSTLSIGEDVAARDRHDWILAFVLAVAILPSLEGIADVADFARLGRGPIESNSSCAEAVIGDVPWSLFLSSHCASPLVVSHDISCCWRCWVRVLAQDLDRPSVRSSSVLNGCE